MQEVKNSILTIEQDKRISMSGVDSVDTFSENAITLTVAGRRVRIEGSKLKVLSFSEGSGNFTASGAVTLVRYVGAKGIRKLFK